MDEIDIRKYPIYCINLDKRPERYNFFMSQPGVNELKNIQRFSAIDGQTLDIVNNPSVSNSTKYNILHKTRRSHGEIDTVGAIGCSMSHYSVWKKFLETNEPYCLVLEDDAQVKIGLADSISAASSSKIQGGFDVWCLSYKLYDKTLNPVPNAASVWKSPNYFWGTSAYIISRRGAERLIEGFFPIECHLDRYMCLKGMLGEIRIVIHANLLTYTLPYGTDIQLNKCSLCDYPDDLKDSILVKKYSVYIPIAFLVISSLWHLYR